MRWVRTNISSIYYFTEIPIILKQHIQSDWISNEPRKWGDVLRTLSVHGYSKPWRTSLGMNKPRTWCKSGQVSLVKFQTTDTYVAAKKLSHCETVALWNSLETWKTSSIPLRCHWNPTVNSGKVPGRVLPLCWAIYMCCHFDPLFWPSEDWTQSFWGTFSYPPTPKSSFWVPILPELHLFDPKFHFASIF